MAKVEPRVLRGFRDYLPPKMIPRQKMLASVEATFQRFGFVPLMTPALEYLEVLMGKYGVEGDKLLYRFKDHGDRDVGLRYDLTVPLARVVAQHANDIQLPFRRYQIAPVWRAENPAHGRFREFVQCDGDIVGSADMCADAEVVQLACELLAGLGVGDFTVRLNNRKVLTGLMESIGVAPGEAEAGILRTIDKLPKIGEEEAAKLLGTENGLDRARVERVLEFLKIGGGIASVLEQLRRLFAEGSIGRKGADELAEVFEVLEGSGLAAAVEVDLSIARGLDYYTGTIYETFLKKLPGIGSVMSGGRYDGLIGVFKGQDVPAVGISLGVDRLLEALVELGLLQEEKCVAQVLVTVFGRDVAGYAAKAARLLRDAGIRCELYPAYAKMGKQFSHADRAGERWVVVAGSNEAAKNEVAVKDLVEKKQEAVPLDGLVAYLRSRLDGPA